MSNSNIAPIHEIPLTRDIDVANARIKELEAENVLLKERLGMSNHVLTIIRVAVGPGQG